jgi:hypothetical protein
MPNVIRRALKSRQFRGEPFAARVTAWLNSEGQKYGGKNSRASRRRILDLIDCIRETLATIETEPLYKAEPRWDLIKRPFTRKLAKLINEVNERIAEYPLLPTFSVSFERKDEWDFDDAICGEVPAGESLAARGVMELARHRLLDRIRCCICGRWFFARFMHQRSCSGKCRHKNYEQSEEFKENRRTYMRNYYRLKTSGKVK